MRATLHDELMREAGFETEHGVAERLRKERRRRVLLSVAGVLFVVGSAAEAALHFGLLHYMPRRVGVVVAILAALGASIPFALVLGGCVVRLGRVAIRKARLGSGKELSW